MQIKLHVHLEVPDEASRDFDLSFDQPKITLGRDKNNDVQLPLSTISRHHAVILREDKEWFVQDLRSTHGTLYNGEPLLSGGKRVLKNQDVLQIVHYQITVDLSDEASQSDFPDEQTSVVAKKMMQEALSELASGDDIPYLRVMNGPQEGKKVELGQSVSELVIGRSDKCDLQLDDVNISRRHARIQQEWGEIFLEDMGSKNGVVVNGERIEARTALKDKDEISLGAIRLTFIDPDASMVQRLSNVPAFANRSIAPPPPAKPEARPAQTPPAEHKSTAPDKLDKIPNEPYQTQLPTKTKMAATDVALIGLAVITVVGLIAGAFLILFYT